MSIIGTYSFLPWLRQGLANQIATADFDPAVKVRASINIDLALTGDKIGGGTATESVSRPMALFGPGDIVGIDKRAIVRVEPRDWVTNFEPNYLPAIEFYDEDFPWRYTPAAPDLGRGRLRPWLALVVLAEGEFKDGKAGLDRPLPYIDVDNLAAFPRADELWAWAHVHVNRSLAAGDSEFVSTDANAVQARLGALLADNPDLAYSRIISPRKLAENTAYHAFLVPTFETGRRAGLKIEIGDDVPATLSAWDAGPRPEPQSFPYYHRWFFHTGARGDFEMLVRLLKPKPVDPRVGTREMDVQYPGANVAGLDKPELGGILKLGGALRPPAKVPAPPPDLFETWDDPFPRPLQEDLARLINLPDDYQRAGDPDPVIAPPLYGTWHALTKRVLSEADGAPAANPDNWVHRLNLDPRFRVPAGFGTRIIQDNQEKYMDAAWEQVGNVLEAQRRIRFGQFAVKVSEIWYDRHLLPLVGVSRQKALLLMAPLNKRILAGAFTIHHAQATSLLQPVMTSAPLRRIIRPRGRLISALPFDAARPPDQLIDRVNRGEVSAAPPKQTPAGLFTADQAADALVPAAAPPWVVDWLKRLPRLPWLVILVAILIALLCLLLLSPTIGVLLAALVIAGAVYLRRWLDQWAPSVAASEALKEDNQTPAAVDAMPGAGGFVITEPGSGYVPGRGPDSQEATRFKTALKEGFALVQASAVAGSAPVRRPLDLDDLTATAVKAINPTQTIPRRIRAGLFVPPRLIAEIGEAFVEPMAYPVIDQPMYEPLTARSSELFLPNINLIANNSITLLETNQRFIESYMVGLNHEFARELLWREYPTDQRGSTFRQFWDVRSFFNRDKLDDAALKEKLRDIKPLHTWSRTSSLGSHDNREAVAGATEEELVLVIRGELLKRYPTAVIYAHRAVWQRKDDGTEADKAREPWDRHDPIDNLKERRLAPLTAAEEANPPKSKVLTPLYQARVEPDIHFFGFDLTVDKAKGGTGAHPDDDPGWFFVIKERPGEPRFGLDIEKQPKLNVWNDLAWDDVQPNAPGSHIEIATAPAAFTLVTPTGTDSEKAVQFADDKKIAWSRAMSSAELAYILFQAPVLVGVHASEMLPK
ncbi:hypothetical protein [Chelatococcus asaccharovorans]|uniref:hypothetical protein n=1 Tax=Chelatococcus asaccharovorans TaxID=28210 RepID=UPI00224C6558|nr:hypothetical protein [Chelatococcus asaccharovorans]CAH1651145.1 conserved hypothetical protein [Chelatococcus asaccharovorans]CAH1692755.1 conserved hypothetical protein [Chelatococcus asaccharovorans]